MCYSEKTRRKPYRIVIMKVLNNYETFNENDENEREDKRMFFFMIIETEEDKRKFMTLYEEYEHFMLWAAREIVEDTYTAEDITHDVFEKIADKIQCVGEPISARTKRYLYVLTRNKAIDHLRKERRRSYIESVPLDDIEVGEEQEIPSLRELNDETIIMEALHRLPDDYKNLFLLKYVECVDNKEIAKMLNMKEGTVRQRLARGKVLLRKELEKVRKEKEE